MVNRKLLISSIYFDKSSIGIAKYSGEMAEWFVSQGYEVEVIAAVPHYPLWKIGSQSKNMWKSEVINGVKVNWVPIYLPPSAILSGGGRILYEASFAINSLRFWIPYLVTGKFDRLISVYPSLPSMVMPAIYAFLKQTYWILHVQDLQVDVAVELGILSNKTVARSLYKLENFYLKKASVVSSITKAMMDKIEVKTNKKDEGIFFPNWSDTDFISPRHRETSFRERHGFIPTDMLFLYSGNMGEKQGLELILEAAKLLQDKIQIKFLLCGAGSTKAQLEARAKEMQLSNVTFLPLQEIEDLPELLASGDVHLVIQKQEAADLVMPSKVTNILAAGRPLIATASPGTTLHEVVVGEAVGLATPPGNLDAFVQATLELAGNKTTREQMGVRARTYAEKYLEKESILRQFESQIFAGQKVTHPLKRMVATLLRTRGVSG